MIREGRARPVKNRYYLLHPGITEVTKRCGLDLQWQVTENGLQEIYGLFQALEATYEVMIRLFQSNALILPYYLPLDPSDDPALLRLNGNTRISGFRWVKAHRKGFRPLAIAEYKTEDGLALWVPVYWFGKNFGRTRAPLKLESLYGKSKTTPIPWHATLPASPIGSVVIGIDEFAVWRARNELFSNHPAAIITAGGDLISQLEPDCPFGTFLETGDKAGAKGLPDNITHWSNSDARARALRGVVNTHLLEIVEDSPSATKQQVEERAGRRAGTLREHFKDLIDADLIRNFKRHLYMGVYGVATANERDVAQRDAVHGDYLNYLDPESVYRDQQLWHDLTLVKIQRHLADRGIHSVQGRRLNIPFKTSREVAGADKTILKPDLWVAVPVREGIIVWHAFELERSIYATNSLLQKRRPHFVAHLQETEVPLLTVADRDTHGNWSAQQRAKALRTMFGNLPMIATTLGEFLSGDFYGPESVWRKGEDEQVVAINNLAHQFHKDGTSQYIHRTFGTLIYEGNVEDPHDHRG